MKVTLIARPEYVGYNTASFDRARGDQMQGTGGEKIAEHAGRTCYDSFGRGRDSAGFAANIIDHKHVNVLYHSVYVMEILDVSRNLSHELVRHHVGFSPSQRSTRYCDERYSYVIDHPEIARRIRGGQSSLAWVEAYSAFHEAWRSLYSRTVEELTDDGCERKTAQGAAARYLPNGIATNLVWSGNIAAFKSMIERRSEPVVDEEFRLLVGEMLKIMRAEAPRYFEGGR